jgi:hypothetical protein
MTEKRKALLEDIKTGRPKKSSKKEATAPNNISDSEQKAAKSQPRKASNTGGMRPSRNVKGEIIIYDDTPIISDDNDLEDEGEPSVHPEEENEVKFTDHPVEEVEVEPIETPVKEEQFTSSEKELAARKEKLEECFQFVTAGDGFDGSTGNGYSTITHPSLVNFFSSLEDIPMTSASNNFIRQSPEDNSFILGSSIFGDVCDDIPENFLETTKRVTRLKKHLKGEPACVEELNHVSMFGAAWWIRFFTVV